MGWTYGSFDIDAAGCLSGAKHDSEQRVFGSLSLAGSAVATFVDEGVELSAAMTGGLPVSGQHV